MAFWGRERDGEIRPRSAAPKTYHTLMLIYKPFTAALAYDWTWAKPSPLITGDCLRGWTWAVRNDIFRVRIPTWTPPYLAISTAVPRIPAKWHTQTQTIKQKQPPWSGRWLYPPMFLKLSQTSWPEFPPLVNPLHWRIRRSDWSCWTQLGPWPWPWKRPERQSWGIVGRRWVFLLSCRIAWIFDVDTGPGQFLCGHWDGPGNGDLFFIIVQQVQVCVGPCRCYLLRPSAVMYAPARFYLVASFSDSLQPGS